MDQVFTTYSLIFLGTSLVAFFSAFLAWQRRMVRGAREMVWLTLLSGFWAFSAMFESAAVTTEHKVLWSQIGYIGAVTTPVLYLWFVMRFTGQQQWMKTKVLVLLFFVPVITWLAALTNESHGWIWSGFSPVSPDTNLMVYYHGPGFYILYFIYSYLLLILATALLVRFIRNQTRIYRLQGLVIFLAGLCPWIASILYLSNGNPVPGLDIVPLSIVLSCVLFLHGMLYRRFLDLVPVARKTLMETLSDGILALDRLNRIQDLNRAALNLLELPDKSVIGKDITQVVDTNNPMISAILKGTGEEVSRGTGRNIHHYRVISKEIENPHGSRLLVIRDITLQRQTEAEILRRDKLLDAIAKATALLVQAENIEEAINGALALIGEAAGVNRVYIFWNHEDPEYKYPLMSQAFEWTDGTVTAEINNPELQNVPYEIACPRWYELLSAGKVVAGNIREFPEPEKIALSAQGIVSVLVTPIFIDQKFSGLVGFDDCYTEREWPVTEERILTAAAGTIGAAYMRHRSREELLKAKIKAEESDRLKSAFLANMSHEIRTPMNGILGFLNLLQTPDLTSTEKEDYIRIVRKSAERMLSTVHDIIDISRIESGQMPLVFSTINLNELMVTLKEFFTPEATGKHLQLFLQSPVDDNNAVIYTDREKLTTVLTNLIKNALKYTPKGYVEYGFHLRGDFTEFYVRDTGIGISPDRQEAVFERFIQADISHSRKYEGAGLGLSIARAYVEMLGGRITLESEPERGSTFRFTIPLRQHSGEHKASPEMPGLSGKKEIRSCTILVTEDDPVNLEYIRLALLREGHRVITASNGAEAIAALRRNQEISLVLMDIRLPGMDGYETTLEIRKWNSTIPVIAHTAYAFEGDREKALAAGCNDYLSKPVREKELLRCIHKYLL